MPDATTLPALHAAPPRAGPREYILGHGPSEQQRLLLQAAILRGWTEQFFRAAGLTAGMRVLDVGCGLGDVSLLAAELVGPAGRVAGIDREPIVLERARDRAAQAGLADRVCFVQAAIEEAGSSEPFDAVVGRYVLLYLADPVAALRRLARLVRPGGLVVFHELDFEAPITLWPEAPLWTWAYGLLAKGARSAGVPPDFGKRLGRTFLDAGLPWPTLRAVVPVGGGAGSYLYPWLAESLRTLLPILERAGLTSADELQVDTLAARLEAEAVGLGCQVMAGTQFGAWATRP